MKSSKDLKILKQLKQKRAFDVLETISIKENYAKERDAVACLSYNERYVRNNIFFFFLSMDN